jgi:hypothetical protein
VTTPTKSGKKILAQTTAFYGTGRNVPKGRSVPPGIRCMSAVSEKSFYPSFLSDVKNSPTPQIHNPLTL